MLKQVVFAALAMVLVTQAQAEESKVEAFVSKVSFDGKTVKYSVDAYDTAGPVVVEAEAVCGISQSEGSKVLKSIQVKLFLKADFNKPGSVVTQTGQVKVMEMIRTCGKGMKFRKAPVEVILPRVSMSVK